MKKIIFIVIIGLFLGACATKQTIVPATNDEGSVVKFFKLPATHNGFSRGNSQVNGPVLKKEIEGAVVSLEGGGFIITPEVSADTTTTHERGGVLRDIRIEGDDPISLLDNSVFLVETAFFKKGAKSPDSLHIFVISSDSLKFCLPMVRTNKGNYIPKVRYRIEKKKVYSELVKVYSVDEEGNKKYVKFRKKGGGFIYKYKLSKLPSKYFKDGKLKEPYKIQRIPVVKEKKEDGTLVYKYSIRKIYDVDGAGYKFISPCGRVCYISNKDIKTQFIWGKQEIDDRRQMIYSNGYKNPNE